MYWFLIPLILGFASNLASAFTTTYSVKWGKANGTLISILLRDIFGIPLWAVGFIMAINESSRMLYDVSLMLKTISWSIIIAGGVIIVIALVRIRTKAAAPSTVDTLVRNGIYFRIRHPIHSGTFLEFIGVFFTLAFFTGCNRMYFGDYMDIASDKIGGKGSCKTNSGV